MTYFFVTLFLVMMGYLVYFNVVRSKEIINSPYNVRMDSLSDRVVRGSILDKNGEVRDYPKYEVRGFMLDVGRRPFSKKIVNEVAKTMAFPSMITSV